MATSAADGAAPAAPFHLGSILAPLVAIVVGVFMVILDATAVNVAVPSLVRDFHSSLSTVQWTITGYALAQAAVIPLAGWLSDRYGAKPMFLTSVVLFTIGSVLCATAQSDLMLIVFRLLQGLGGGFVLPIAMAYVYRLAPPERVGVVMGMMGIPILLAPALGPVVAGWLVQYHSWRWIFLLNLPVGIFGVFMGLRTLPRIDRQTVAALDLPGTILGPLAFAALSYGISEGSTSWTSGKTLGGLIVGTAALVAFVVVELRTRTPLLELRVFRSTDFDLAMVAQSAAQFALFGTLFLVPLYLQELRGYGAFDTGLILLPQAIAAAVFMPIGGTLYDRIGARPLVVVGLGIVAAATFLLSRVGPATQGTDLLLPLGMAGAGMGLMMMALNTHLISAAPRSLVSRVTSLTNALQQVVTSFAVAGLATILTSRTSTHVHTARASFFAQHPAFAAGKVSKAAAAQLGHQLQLALGGAFANAFDDTFLYMVGLGIMAALIGFLLRRNPVPREIGTEDIGTQATEAMATGTAFPL